MSGRGLEPREPIGLDDDRLDQLRAHAKLERTEQVAELSAVDQSFASERPFVVRSNSHARIDDVSRIAAQVPKSPAALQSKSTI